MLEVKSEEWKWRVVVNKVIGHFGHFRFGDAFSVPLYKYNFNYIYIVSRKESVKSFLTLMTHDLNDRVSLCSKWKVKSEKWRVVVNKVIGHYGHFRFSISTPINHRFNKFTRTKLYTINLHHKCRETDDGPSGKVLQNQAKCRTFALAIGW